MIKKTFLVLGWLASCMAVSVTTIAFADHQARRVNLATLSTQKAEISKIDWLLMDSRVTALAQMYMWQPSVPASPLNFTYDSVKDRIVASSYVNPNWLVKARADEIKDTLGMRAVEFCGAAASLTMLKSSVPYGLDWKNWCSVRFVTISGDEIALYENGQLVVK